MIGLNAVCFPSSINVNSSLFFLEHASSHEEPQTLQFMASVAQENPGTSSIPEISSTSARLKLYSFWRSSCAWRVRIGLNLKGLPYEYKAVNLLQGEQFSEEFTKLNPLQLVPTLVDGDVIISDSLAILLYLEDKYPEHPLIPDDLRLKAISLQVSAIVGSSIQPLQLMSMSRIVAEKVEPKERLEWAKLFIEKGFTALETLLKDVSGKYSLGDQITLLQIHPGKFYCTEYEKSKAMENEIARQAAAEGLPVVLLYPGVLYGAGKLTTGNIVASMADVFLVPQIFNGERRFNVDMSKFPTLDRINQALKEVPEFQAALPEKTPDAKA